MTAEQSVLETSYQIHVTHRETFRFIFFEHLGFIFLCKSCSNRLKKSNEMQQYADIYLLLNYCTCFGRPSRPSSGVHKTVVAASGTDHTIWGVSFLKRSSFLFMFQKACSPHSMICTRGCNYSFMYS